MATLKLEIVTPEEKIYSEDVEMVTLPGSEGELGVYPKHVPLLTTVVPGELRVLKGARVCVLTIASSRSNTFLLQSSNAATASSRDYRRKRRVSASACRCGAKSWCKKNRSDCI